MPDGPNETRADATPLPAGDSVQGPFPLSRPRRRGLGALLAWTPLEQGMLLAAVSLPFYLVYALAAHSLLGGAALGHLDLRILAMVRNVSLVTAAIWALLLALGWWLRRLGATDPPWFAQLVAQTFTIACVLLTYCMGPFTSLPWIVLIGAFAGGSLLFSRRRLAFAVASGLVVLLTLVLLGWAGMIPYAPLADSPPTVGSTGSYIWLAIVVGLHVVFLIILGALFTFLITQWKAQQSELQVLSQTDALTEVANRRALLEGLERALTKGVRRGRPVSVLMIDLDGFKPVNDRFGHLVGDDLLKAVARAIEGSVRDSDLVGRYGGDEFVVVLAGAGPEAARTIGERCRERVAAVQVAANPDGSPVGVTASIGIALAEPERAPSSDAILKEADEALYRAKQGGRDRLIATADG